MAPWAVDDTLSYGYAAVSASVIDRARGRCYELKFTGTSNSDDKDEGSAGLCGKRMIVQVTNTGGDVEATQFDLLIPGGGVGAFDGCSKQWSASSSELGAQYGGVLSACISSMGLPRPPLDDIKECVRDACDALFGASKFSDLAAGCAWFVDWFHIANNPTFVYNEVACPEALLSRSGLRRSDSSLAGGCF